MVEFDLVAALVGGLVATVVMTGMMTMAASMGVTDMPSMPLISGSMVTGERAAATRIGAVVHYLVMGTIVFGIAYGLLFTTFDNDSWWIGALSGLVHGAIVGVVFMPMMPLMHPRMRRELVDAGASANGEVEIVAPGLLGKNWGVMTPVGMLMGHAVYGLVLALVYGWVA